MAAVVTPSTPMPPTKKMRVRPSSLPSESIEDCTRDDEAHDVEVGRRIALRYVPGAGPGPQ